MRINCPVCKEELKQEAKRYLCPNKHSFDLAKEGYLNLNLRASNNTGDDSEMMKARSAFLNKNYYHFLRVKVNEIIKELKVSNIVDLACGEGYYTSYFDVEDKLGIDLSKTGLKYASKHDKSTCYILKTIFDLPLTDESVDLLVTIFAPISNELKRVLKPRGYFLLVHPDVEHLYELKAAVYDKPYPNEVVTPELAGLNLIKNYRIENKALLTNEDLINLFKMTPYFHKTSKKDFEKLKEIEQLEVSFSFVISLYQKS